MSTYGRNFEFRVPPEGAERAGRYSLGGSDPLAIGAPVVVTGATDASGRLVVTKAAADADKPLPGQGGVLVYEYGPAAYAGDDPQLTTYSDKSTVAVGEAVQVVNGDGVKVVLRNTAASTFLTLRNYAGRTMVAGLGATPTLQVGDKLCPGTGNDSAGYWKETSDAAKAWLVVTKVDTTRGEVEARLNF
jgi:hypothetical protein